jgi:hypothetical protein
MSKERAHSDAPNKEAKMEAQTTQETTKTEATLRSAEHSAAKDRERVIEACRRAVATLEDFAAMARREVERAAELEPHELADLPSTVASQSAWGAANAASELRTAIRLAAQYTNTMGLIEALKG